jgi:hypothetical protein
VAGGGGRTLAAPGVAIAASAQLDLMDNVLLTDVSLDGIREELLGRRIVSGAPDPRRVHALGYAAGTGGGVAERVLLALVGDLNLDGVIDEADYATLAASYAAHLPNAHWTDGDVNYDAVVDGRDWLLVDRAFLLTRGPGFDAGPLLAERGSQFGGEYVSELLASVPEPSLLVAGVGWVGVVMRRRRDVGGVRQPGPADRR